MPLLQFQQMNVNLARPCDLVNYFSDAATVKNIFENPLVDYFQNLQYIFLKISTVVTKLYIGG